MLYGEVDAITFVNVHVASVFPNPNMLQTQIKKVNISSISYFRLNVYNKRSVNVILLMISSCETRAR